LHIDAAQAIGKLPIEMAGASTMCLSPHKFYGICGSGVLVKREGVVLEPLIHGGASTSLYRSGTPALGLAAACHKALDLAMTHQAEWLAKVTVLREYLLRGLGIAHDNGTNHNAKVRKSQTKITRPNAKTTPYPLIRINSPAEGSPYILNLSVKGIKGAQFVAELNKYGICVSVKSACSVDSSPSRPVMAISRDRQNALCSWRVSLSHLTDFTELDMFLSAFDRCYARGCNEKD